MARSLSNAKVFVSLVADNISIHRRGFAAASQGLAKIGKENGRIGKSVQEEKSWIPDPVTGYYRPANKSAEIDVADLRDIFLNQKVTPQ